MKQPVSPWASQHQKENSLVWVGFLPKGQTKDTRLCGQCHLWREHFTVLTRQGTCLFKIFGKIHIPKAFDSAEFKMRFCSVAKIQFRPHKSGFCGERHMTFREGPWRRATNGATSREPPSPSTEIPLPLPEEFQRASRVPRWRRSPTVSSTICSRFYSLLAELCAVKHFQKTVKM